jgi:hypothetical protein
MAAARSLIRQGAKQADCFHFLLAGKVSHHGVETWQMFKPDGKTWKILSVVWSSHDGP